MEEQIKNNILIAEFLVNNEGNLVKIRDGVYSTIDDNEVPDDDLTINDLKYHKDWNCLMEVVEKIENHNEFCNILFTPNGCAIDVNIENGFHYSIDCDTKIEAVYKACIEFIKWFNNENK